MEGSGGKLILVADDDADVRELVVFRLVHAGYEVITAADGEEAVELVLARRPDLCLVDVMMPKLDGFAVTERVRASPELAETKVLLLTASVHDSAVERGLAVGADDYIAKPFSSERLLERVSAALDPDA
jgi:two-component system, OmpR family, response regulator MtrA